MIQSLHRLCTLNYCRSLHVCRAKARSLSSWVFQRLALVSNNGQYGIACPLRTTRDTQSSVVRPWFTTHSRWKKHEFIYIIFRTCKAPHKVYDKMLESSDSPHNELILPPTNFLSMYNLWGKMRLSSSPMHMLMHLMSRTNKIHNLLTHYQSFWHLYCTRRRTEPRMQYHSWENIETYYRWITRISMVQIQWSYTPKKDFSTFKPPQNEFWRYSKQCAHSTRHLRLQIQEH